MSGRWLLRGMSSGVIAVMVAGAAVLPAHAVASLGFSPTGVDFGAVVVQTSVHRSATLTNSGDAAVTPRSFRFSDWNGPVFVDVSKSTCVQNTPLPAGASCVLDIYAFPDNPGTLEGSVSVWDDSNAPVATLGITGRAVSPPPAPDNPKRAIRILLPGNRSEVSWSAVTGATSYEVQSSGRVVCTAEADETTCVTRKALGQRVGVWVMARSAHGVSDGTEAKFRAADSPVMFATVTFRGRSAEVSKAGRAQAMAAGTALAKQGFYKNITVVAATKPGSAVASARAQAVRGIILARYAAYPDLEAPTVGTAVRGSGNTVKITVQ